MFHVKLSQGGEIIRLSSPLDFPTLIMPGLGYVVAGEATQDLMRQVAHLPDMTYAYVFGQQKIGVTGDATKFLPTLSLPSIRTVQKVGNRLASLVTFTSQKP